MVEGKAPFSDSHNMRRASTIRTNAQSVKIEDDEVMEDIDKVMNNIDTIDALYAEMEQDCLGHLEISLYWEEKFVLILKFA